MMVGGAWWQGGSAGLWTGAIDEVRIYQGVLTSRSGDWQFATCTGTPVVCPDQGTGNHPITLFTGASWTPGGYNGNGLNFNGSGTASSNGAIVVSTTSAFTAGAWVNLSALPTSDAIVLAQAGAQQDFFELNYSAGRGQWCATVYSADSGTATPTSACAGSAQVGTWVHLAGVFDPVNQRVSLYLDGSLAATATDTASWAATGELLLGRGWRNAVATGYLTGIVSDVQIISGTVADPSTLQ
jgi:hypothetical protein